MVGVAEDEALALALTILTIISNSKYSCPSASVQRGISDGRSGFAGVFLLALP